MASDPTTVQPFPKEVRDIMTAQFGEVIPMSDEEQLKFVVDLGYLARGQMPPPPPQLPSPPVYLLNLLSKLPEEELKKPIINFSVPTLHVPTSVYMFFRTEWKKQKEVRDYNLPDRNGKKAATDAYMILWQSLTPQQRENWSSYFIVVRNQRQRLIDLGYYKKAPSANELRKEARKRHHSQMSTF